mgnify:FL=1
MKEYGFGLDKRPVILVASKMDEEGAQERLEELKKKIDAPIYPISALTDEGIKELIYKCADLIATTPMFPLYTGEEEEELDHKTYELEEEGPEFEIRRIDAHTWRIVGDKIIKYYKMTNISTDDGMMKLMTRIRKLRIDDALEARGAEDGDTVYLDDFAFEYYR